MIKIFKIFSLPSFFLIANVIHAATPYAFVVSGTSVKVESGEVLTIQGSFLCQDAGGVDGSIDNQGRIDFTENWTNTNSGGGNVFSTSSGRVVANGSSATQVFFGPTKTIFYNLTFNSSYGTIPQLALNTDIDVESHLRMVSGVMNLRTQILKLGISAATPGALTYTAGWLYGNVGSNAGFIRWMPNALFAVADPMGHFPIGSSIDYRPFWLGITGCAYNGGAVKALHTGSYPAWYTVASHTDATWGGGTVLQGVSTSTWDISESVTPGVTCAGTRFDIRFGGDGFGTYVLTDLDASLLSSCVGTYAATTNVTVPLEVNRTSLNRTTMFNLLAATPIQKFRIGTKDILQSPLPIELLSFTAVLNANKKVDLNWSTATETNNDFFTVEKTKDGDTFEQVAIVDGAGNSSVTLYYTSLDPNPYLGKSYYRLKQTDFNGEYKYSDLIEVDVNSDGAFLLGSNIVSSQGGYIAISNSLHEEVMVTIYNSIGQNIKGLRLNYSDKVQLIELPYITSGIYLLTIESISHKHHSSNKIVVTN